MGNSFSMSDAEGSSAGDILTSISDLYDDLGLTAATATAAEQQIILLSIRRAEGAVFRHLKYNPAMSVKTEFYPRLDMSLGSREAVWESNDSVAYLRYLADAATNELQIGRLPIREKDTEGANGIDLRIDYDGRSGTRSGSFASDTLKVEGTDFYPNYDLVDSNGYKVCMDGVIKSEGRWPAIAGSVKITYVAGYSALELAGTDSVIDASPIREACIDEAVRRVHKAYSRMKKRTGFGTGALTSERLGDYSYSADGKILNAMVGTSADIMAETALKLESFVNFGAMLGS